MVDLANKRSHRVAQLIQEELARLLVDGLKDPRVGFVTVTHVHLTPDLRNAQVHVSLFGQTKDRQASLTGLRAASGYLRRELGHSLKLRVVPEISFVQDDSLDYAQRVDVLLNAAARGEHDVPEASAPQEALPEAHTARSGVFTLPPSTQPAARKGSGRARLTGRKSRSSRRGGSGPKRRQLPTCSLHQDL